MMPGGGDVIVLMIAGYGRSGSTLLDRMLGQIPGFVSTGEICHIWERSFLEGQLCGCGKPFADCSFWVAARRAAFGEQGPDAQAVAGLQERVARLNSLPRLLWPWMPGKRFRRDLAAYRHELRALYEGIAGTSGARVIVDSSKDPLHGFVVAGIDGVDLRVLHLVRDARAVAHSWMRKRVRPEVHWETQMMPVFPPTRSSLVWNVKNQLVDRLMSRVTRSSRMRYEDLVAHPARVLKAALSELGLADFAGDMAFLRERTVELAADHTAAGNPMRFKTGSLDLRLDEEWQRHMAGNHRRYVTFLTWPWLRKYGYR